MKKLILICILACAASTADAQTLCPVGGDTFVIRESYCTNNCSGDTIVTEQVWYDGVMLDVTKDKGKPATEMHIKSISFVTLGDQEHVLLIESTSVLGIYNN